MRAQLAKKLLHSFPLHPLTVNLEKVCSATTGPASGPFRWCIAACLCGWPASGRSQVDRLGSEVLWREAARITAELEPLYGLLQVPTALRRARPPPATPAARRPRPRMSASRGAAPQDLAEFKARVLCLLARCEAGLLPACPDRAPDLLAGALELVANAARLHLLAPRLPAPLILQLYTLAHGLAAARPLYFAAGLGSWTRQLDFAL